MSSTFYTMFFFLSCQMGNILFGVHLPVMGFDNSNHDKNAKDESPNTREQILSIIKKAESLGYDSLSVNNSICFKMTG